MKVVAYCQKCIALGFHTSLRGCFFFFFVRVLSYALHTLDISHLGSLLFLSNIT